MAEILKGELADAVHALAGNVECSGNWVPCIDLLQLLQSVKV